MMKNIGFNKLCEVGKLGKELRAAGFNIVGVTSDGATKTIVHLSDTETKNPASVVDAHIFEIPTARVLDFEKLKQVLKDKKIIKDDKEIEKECRF